MKENMNKEIVVEEMEKKESKIKAFATKAKEAVKRNWKPFIGGAAVASLAALALASRKLKEENDSYDPVIENEIDAWRSNQVIESDNNSQEVESE